MRKFFYARLAAENLKKNRQIYRPYLLSCSLTCAMLYIISSLSMNEGLENMKKGAETTTTILKIGTFLAMFFAAIFLFYTNSFLIKHRRKEFGLYQLLGMEKRHLARVLLIETGYSMLITMLIGFTVGILLDKLAFLLILRILDAMSFAEIPLGFHISGFSMLYVTAFLGVVFLLILLNAMRIVHFSNPITMLNEANAGEREPKTKLVMAILGVILLGTGYTMSICAKSTDLIYKLMLPGVLCVIIGTYFLFIAGSIALLKFLKKRKSYYYKTRHFTAVSGMIFRMKQNAAGLAGICILSTMVLVMISSATNMLLGMNDTLRQEFPREAVATCFSSADSYPDSFEKINAYLAEKGITPENTLEYAAYIRQYLFTDGKIQRNNTEQSTHYLTVIPSNLYKERTGNDIPLQPDEILFSCSTMPATLRQQIEIFGVKFTIKQLVEPVIGWSDAPDSLLVVVSDLDAMKKIAMANDTYLEYYYAFDMPVERETELFGEMEERWNDDSLTKKFENTYFMFRDEERTMYLSIFGGLFFIAMFLGFLFTMQMVLMIYYKQISEGHDDRRRYAIMQNVGMSLTEIRQTIRSQILTVFFLPLIVAAIHTAFCIPIITRVLSEMCLTNLPLIYLILGCTFLVFSVLYALIYATTAKVYYKIVSADRKVP